MTKRNRPYRQRRGVLSFEWIVLITIVAVGIVGGLTAVRDAIVEELGDVAGAAVAIDQSFTGFGTSFVDTRGTVTTCRPKDGKGGVFGNAAAGQGGGQGQGAGAGQGGGLDTP